MVYVRVKLFGTLRRLSLPATPGVWEGELPTGITIRDMLEILGAGQYEANAAVINGEPAGLDSIIPDNSEIVVVTPMGGG